MFYVVHLNYYHNENYLKLQSSYYILLKKIFKL